MTAMAENRRAAAIAWCWADWKASSGPGSCNCQRSRPRPRNETRCASGRRRCGPWHRWRFRRSPPLRARTRTCRRSSAWRRGGVETLFEAADESPMRDLDAATLARLAAGSRRLHALRRTGAHADADRVRRRQSAGAALLSWARRRGPTKTGWASRSSAAPGSCSNKIIEACRLKREDVYILNMLKCRPPGNRNPLPDELTNCRPFLERQLELIQPEFICCLGAVASQNLLDTTTSIGKLRGKLHAYRGAKVVCTFHPAYLLRNPAAKKDAWDDMKFLMREMGVEL